MPDFLAQFDGHERHHIKLQREKERLEAELARQLGVNERLSRLVLQRLKRAHASGPVTDRDREFARETIASTPPVMVGRYESAKLIAYCHEMFR